MVIRINYSVILVLPFAKAQTRPSQVWVRCQGSNILLKFSPKWTENGQRRSLWAEASVGKWVDGKIQEQCCGHWASKHQDMAFSLNFKGQRFNFQIFDFYLLEIQDDQEALIDTQLSMASGSKTDVKSKSRPSSLKISDSNIESEETEEENRSLGCQVKNLPFCTLWKLKCFIQDIKQFCPTCIILLITVVIMVTVIPYAFSNVIK